MTADLYDDLGVDDDADAATIKAAYRRRAQDTHPDKEGGDASEFRAVQLAYEVLSDPKRRATYDESGDTDKEPDVVTSRVVNVFKAVMEEYPEGDLIQHAQGMVTEAIVRLTTMMQQQESRKSKLIKRSTRIKIKTPGGHDLYRQLMTAEISDCVKTIGEMKKEIDINHLVRNALNEYEDVNPTGYYR